MDFEGEVSNSKGSTVRPGTLDFAVTHTKPGIPNDLHPNCARVINGPYFCLLFCLISGSEIDWAGKHADTALDI